MNSQYKKEKKIGNEVLAHLRRKEYVPAYQLLCLCPSVVTLMLIHGWHLLFQFMEGYRPSPHLYNKRLKLFKLLVSNTENIDCVHQFYVSILHWLIFNDSTLISNETLEMFRYVIVNTNISLNTLVVPIPAHWRHPNPSLIPRGTPLSYAIELGSREVFVDILLKAGASTQILIWHQITYNPSIERPV